jgi:hypothetical protein
MGGGMGSMIGGGGGGGGPTIYQGRGRPHATDIGYG